MVFFCDLRAVMNGPPIQSLKSVSTPFILDHGRAPGEQEKLTTVLLGGPCVAILLGTQTSHKSMMRLRMTDVKSISKQVAEGRRAPMSELEVDLPEGFQWGLMLEKLDCKLLSHGTLLVGYFYVMRSRTLTTRPKSQLRLLMFKYFAESGQIRKVADGIHQIHHNPLALAPKMDLREHTGFCFGSCKGRIFCIVPVDYSKSAIQVYCVYKNSFLPIGGTNCKTPGLYIFSYNHKVTFTHDDSLGGLYGTGTITTIDPKQRTVTHKFFEMRFCF